MQPMGIHTNYKSERRRACISYAISLFIINSVAALNNIVFYLSGAMDIINMSALQVAFDTLQISVSVTIAVTLNCLLHNVHIRFAALNLLLRYVIWFCSNGS